MKKICLFILIYTSLNVVFSQETVSFDFQAQKLAAPLQESGYIAISYKGYVNLEITSLDTCKYSVEVNKAEVTYTYPQEEEKSKSLKLSQNSCLTNFYYRINNIDSDEMIVTITTKIKKTNKKLPNVSFTIRTYGQWKINMSSGAVFNAFLSNENYEIRDNTIIDAGNENVLVPLFPTVLMHAYKKNHTGFNWGTSFGFGISDGDNASFYTGLGFLFGEEQRFVLSFGGALRKVTRLKNQYSVGQNFTENTPDVSDITADPYRLGGFFSITYNLTSKKN